MPADDADGPGGRAAAIGFHSYADDTLGVVPDVAPGKRHEAWAEAEPPARRRSGMAIGLGLALVAAAAVAVAWSLTPANRVAPAAPAAPPVSRPQTVAPPAIPAVPAPARAIARPHAEPYRAPPASPARARPQSAAPADRRPDPPVIAPAAVAPAAVSNDSIGERLASLPPSLPTPISPAPAPASRWTRLQPSFDCGYAQSLAQRMVCDDPELAAADRRMSRAYRAALAAGAPEEDLRLEQQDWLAIREDAARHSPRAVANIYAQRIEDLREWRAEAANGRRP